MAPPRVGGEPGSEEPPRPIPTEEALAWRAEAPVGISTKERTAQVRLFLFPGELHLESERVNSDPDLSVSVPHRLRCDDSWPGQFITVISLCVPLSILILSDLQ